MSKMQQHLHFATTVQADFQIVKNNFGIDLFKALKPTFPPMQLLCYDGEEPGDEVHLRLGLWPIQIDWISKIVERLENDDLLEFVDEGLRLPCPFLSWRHVHRLERVGEGETQITDDVVFEGAVGFGWLAKMLAKGQLAGRGKGYTRYFANLQTE